MLSCAPGQEGGVFEGPRRGVRKESYPMLGTQAKGDRCHCPKPQPTICRASRANGESFNGTKAYCSPVAKPNGLEVLNPMGMQTYLQTRLDSDGPSNNLLHFSASVVAFLWQHVPVLHFPVPLSLPMVFGAGHPALL